MWKQASAHRLIGTCQTDTGRGLPLDKLEPFEHQKEGEYSNKLNWEKKKNQKHRSTVVLKREAGQREEALSNIRMPAMNDKLENQFCHHQCNNWFGQRSSMMLTPTGWKKD